MGGNGDDMWSLRDRIRIVWLCERHRRGDDLHGSHRWPEPQLGGSDLLSSVHQCITGSRYA